MKASFTLEQLSKLTGVTVTGVLLPMGVGWDGAKLILEVDREPPAHLMEMDKNSRDTSLHGCGAPMWVCDRIGCAAVIELMALGHGDAYGVGQETGLMEARRLVEAEQLILGLDNDGDNAYRQAVNDCLGAIDTAIVNRRSPSAAAKTKEG